MTIRLMGTGASDGVPSLFSDSRVSRFAREHGGRDLRSRAAALIDGQLKIDLGPDTHSQLVAAKSSSEDWNGIVFTHSDADHFSVKEIQYALYPFTQRLFPHFAIYGNQAICDAIDYHYPDWPIERHVTKSFEPFTHAEYTITPIRARHSPEEDCHNLIVDDGRAKALYATDTGIWEAETWEFLASLRLDALVLECTNGRRRSDYLGHLNLEGCLDVIERLRSMGTLREGALVATTHHSHDGDMTYDELREALEPYQLIAGYDGLNLDVAPQ